MRKKRQKCKFQQKKIRIKTSKYKTKISTKKSKMEQKTKLRQENKIQISSRNNSEKNINKILKRFFSYNFIKPEKNYDYKKRLRITFGSFICSLKGYTCQDSISDFISGIVLGFIRIPQAMAYATLCGVAPQYGLYTGRRLNCSI